MILQCPQCNARFLVPSGAVGTSGRSVRCGRCQHGWVAYAPADEPSRAAASATPALTSAMPDFDVLMADASRPPTKVSAAQPVNRNLPMVREVKHAPWWLRAIALTSAAACALVSVLTWQPAWLGLPPSVGVQLKDLKYSKTQNKSKQTRYLVEGMIVNNNNHRIAAPIVRISLLDEAGKKLQFWEFEDASVNIEPGQEIPFTADELDARFSRGTQLVVEIGNALELAMRSSKPYLPPAIPESEKPVTESAAPVEPAATEAITPATSWPDTAPPAAPATDAHE